MPEPGLAEYLVVTTIAVMFVGIPVLILRSVLRNRRDPAIDALRARFAAGEIDEAEYDRLRSVLQRG